ncbi:MAG: hypothetical protein NZL83_01060 [Candidatus Absconditabacterales bacterium]|nr:hypothetical protein [Candidatus Absconditabacterales bacterium]
MKACRIGLMGLDAIGKPTTRFNTRGTVTRAQFGTAFSRLLYGDANNLESREKTKYFEKHLAALARDGVMTQISGNRPHRVEKREYVMIIMQRSAEKYPSMQ